MDLQYKLQYKKGISNAVVDALSRALEINVILVVSLSTPAWLEKLQLGYEDDPVSKQLVTELSLSNQNDRGYSMKDEIIRHKGRVWVGNNTLAQQHILQTLHASGIGGHSGIQATYHRVNTYFSWPKMKKVVTAFVQRCEVYQQAKVEHCKLPGLLQPLPVPDSAWTVISLDFIEGLPKSDK